MAVFQTQPWHEGEEQMHKLTNLADIRDNPSSPFLTPRAAHMLQRYSILALGTLDDSDRPWCTIWGGEPPFAQAVAQSVIGVKTTVDSAYDPVVQALWRGNDDGEVVREEPPGRMISGLSIHLEERGRVKLAGRMIAGALTPEETDLSIETGIGRPAEVQLVIKIDESLGNCPKYLNMKHITSHKPHSKLLSDSPHLTKEGLDLIAQADLFFVASAHAHENMDANHRGGTPGFIRVVQPEDETEGSTIIWPEYSGNNLYQTLGNLKTTPKAGLAIPNFETGDVLYVTGETEVLIGSDAAHTIAKSNLAVKLKITNARLVQDGLPFRGQPINDGALGRSPYNPRIRYLTSEREEEFSNDSANPPVTAELVKKTRLTPTIYRYRFALSDPKVFGPWKPGQYAALDLANELNMGYSHMRDDDPTSLNDDYIRTFTISSAPNTLGEHGEEFEMTVRKVGRVTDWLAWQREGLLEIGIRGFGGDFQFDQTAGQRIGFIAAGIGITPLLGQIDALDLKNMLIWWSVGIRDVGLVHDVLTRHPQLKGCLKIYLTGDESIIDEAVDRKKLKETLKLDKAQVHRRRLQKEDLTSSDGDVDNWYICTAPAMRKMVQEWMPGKSIIFENFDY